MSYTRVIPRDLFNEANLLKCYGRVYIEAEGAYPQAELVFDDTDDQTFAVIQDENSGAILIDNIRVMAIDRRSGGLGTYEHG